MKKLVKILLFLFVINIGYAQEKVRLKEISRIQGVRTNRLIGMGLVVGLNGTGDSSQLAPQMLKNLFKYFGTEIAQSQINSQNVAAVMITADLDPFKKIGDTIDVTVSSINDAKSLEGGILLQTPLRGGDGNIYSFAQGTLTKVDNLTSNKVNGFVPNGGIIEKEVPFKLQSNDKIVLILNNPDFTTAARVADSINKRFNYESAKALDAARIEVKKTYTFNDDIVGFISAIENLTVDPDRKSVIVINEKTGTIVLGETVMVAPVAIAHGDLTISIDGQNDVNDVYNQTRLNPQQANSFVFKGTTVRDVVKMLNAIGAGPDDIIAILEALKTAGAIEAEIKVM